MRLTEREWLIMKALWEDHPATAREVADRLPDEVAWAYTTLKTMLARLATKGAVAESKRGNTSVYEPLVSRRKARRSALSSLLNQAFDGAVAPMLHFLVNERKLSDRQRRELIRLLEEEDKKHGRSK
jgi:BlaI family penicillinase repressor